MTMAIWKYELTHDLTVLQMPVGATVLCVQTQGEAICLWAKVVANPDFPTEPRRFKIYGTGHQVPVKGEPYLGTVQTEGGTYVWHIFETNS